MVNIYPKIQALLARYQDLFREPNQLPPTREIDYHINLKDGVELVNVLPYRYAYIQKIEIEKLRINF